MVGNSKLAGWLSLLAPRYRKGEGRYAAGEGESGKEIKVVESQGKRLRRQVYMYLRPFFIFSLGNFGVVGWFLLLA